MKYSTELQATLAALTDKLLSDIKEIPDHDTSRDRIDDLKQVINFHDWKYYVDASAVIKDFDYDRLFKHLKALEEKYPDLLTPDSPTQRVAKTLTEEFPTVAHSIP